MADLIKHGDKLTCYLGRFSTPDDDIEKKELEVRITPVYNADGSYDKLEVGLEDFTFRYPDDINNEDPAHGSMTFYLGDFYVIVQLNDKVFLTEPEAIEEQIKSDVIDKLGLDKESQVEYKDEGSDMILKDLIAILKKMDVKTVIFNDGNSIDIK